MRLNVVRLATAMLSFCALGPALAASTETQPIDVLRSQVERAITFLKTPEADTDAARTEQREQLCALAEEMFDVRTFSRLVLMSSWQDFEAAQQAQFVEVFSDFLCRYYISRLQLYYAGESVTFVAQEMKSPTRAIVSVVLHWQSMDIPVEVRMVKRDEQWRAFDLAVSGISAVLVYRAQFQPILLRESPQFLIETLQQRIAEQG